MTSVVFMSLKRCGENVEERRYVLLLLNKFVPYETGFVVNVDGHVVMSFSALETSNTSRGSCAWLIVTFYLFREYDDCD